MILDVTAGFNDFHRRDKRRSVIHRFSSLGYTLR
jgi:hypothetical protein